MRSAGCLTFRPLLPNRATHRSALRSLSLDLSANSWGFGSGDATIDRAVEFQAEACPPSIKHDICGVMASKISQSFPYACSRKGREGCELPPKLEGENNELLVRPPNRHFHLFR